MPDRQRRDRVGNCSEFAQQGKGIPLRVEEEDWGKKKKKNKGGEQRSPSESILATINRSNGLNSCRLRAVDGQPFTRAKSQGTLERDARRFFQRARNPIGRLEESVRSVYTEPPPAGEACSLPREKRKTSKSGRFWWEFSSGKDIRPFLLSLCVYTYTRHEDAHVAQRAFVKSRCNRKVGDSRNAKKQVETKELGNFARERLRSRGNQIWERYSEVSILVSRLNEINLFLQHWKRDERTEDKLDKFSNSDKN